MDEIPTGGARLPVNVFTLYCLFFFERDGPVTVCFDGRRCGNEHGLRGDGVWTNL